MNQQPSELPAPIEVPSETPESATDLGIITINHGVIAAIARVAAFKVPGVHEMSPSFVDGIAGFISKGALERGIRVEETEETGLVITIHVVVEFGVRIPRVAWQLQTDVRDAVQEMTGKKVSQVNVAIQGVQMVKTDEQGVDAS